MTREGILIDLSEGGALLLLPRAQDAGKQVSLMIEAGSETVHLSARVIRCTPRPVETESATLARTEYQVAVEFLDVRRDTAETVRRIMQNNRVA